MTLQCNRSHVSRIHPLGVLNSDVQYKDLYDYLNCLEISPCTGWMNSNETLRDLTSQVGLYASRNAQVQHLPTNLIPVIKFCGICKKRISEN